MNLSKLITTAVVTGMLSAGLALADDHAAPAGGAAEAVAPNAAPVKKEKNAGKKMAHKAHGKAHAKGKDGCGKNSCEKKEGAAHADAPAAPAGEPAKH